MSHGTYAIRKRCKELFDLHQEHCPEPSFGESEQHYHRRLLNCAQSLLPRGHIWADADLSRQPSSGLHAIEGHIVRDQIAAFRTNVGPPRMAIEKDDTGREIRRFYGDPEEFWKPFKQPVRRVSKIDTSLCTGKNSEQARAASARVASEAAEGAKALAAFRAGKLSGKL